MTRQGCARATALLALLAAVAGGGYAARELVHSDASTPRPGAHVVACPPRSGWRGIAGPAPRAQAPHREVQVAALINEFRVRHHRYALHSDPGLTAAARYHSLDMVQRGYFAHDAPHGRSFAERLARYTRGTCVAENLVEGPATAAAIVQAWKDSPEHRRVMLLPWVTRIGVGIRVHSGGLVVTADFSS